MGVTYSTHRRDGNTPRILVIKLGDLGINGSIILIKILKDEGVSMWNWIHLSKNRYQFRFLVNSVIVL